MMNKKTAIFCKFFIAISLLAIWHLFQVTIEHYKAMHGSISFDRMHYWLEGVNVFLNQHDHIANALLIISSGHIDTILVSLALWGIFGNTIRPLIGIFLIIIFRQISQVLVSEPIPEDMIWRYPGFPSLVVTYYTTYDFFFSGHTASATLAALEVGNRPYINNFYKILAVLLVFVEVFIILSMRFHYTADVITGIFAAFTAFYISGKVAPHLDKYFNISQS